MSATLASNQVVVTDAADLVGREWFGLISYASLHFEPDGRYRLQESATGWESGGVYGIDEGLLRLNSDRCSDDGIYQVRHSPETGPPGNLLFILVEDPCSEQSRLILNGGVPWKEL